MNTQKEYNHDPIGRYLNSEMAENAPSGFTEKVMSRVSLEARPLKAGGNQEQKSYVPAISLAVILILTGVAFAIPSEGNGFLQMPWMKFFHNIELPALKINLDSLLRFKLPGYLPYLCISILLLSVFDRALSGIFHKEKKQQAPRG
jgi:hypothetical protein